MTQVEVYHYNAFTTKPGHGNPAGIVLDSKMLTTEHSIFILIF
ncbi:hypothetical protein [Rummeliibacillus pycnus]